MSNAKAKQSQSKQCRSSYVFEAFNDFIDRHLLEGHDVRMFLDPHGNRMRSFARNVILRWANPAIKRRMARDYVAIYERLISDRSIVETSFEEEHLAGLNCHSLQLTSQGNGRRS